MAEPQVTRSARIWWALSAVFLAVTLTSLVALAAIGTAIILVAIGPPWLLVPGMVGFCAFIGWLCYKLGL